MFHKPNSWDGAEASESQVLLSMQQLGIGILTKLAVSPSKLLTASEMLSHAFQVSVRTSNILPLIGHLTQSCLLTHLATLGKFEIAQKSMFWSFQADTTNVQCPWKDCTQNLLFTLVDSSIKLASLSLKIMRAPRQWLPNTVLHLQRPKWVWTSTSRRSLKWLKKAVFLSYTSLSSPGDPRVYWQL